MLMIPEPGRIPRGESDWIQTFTGRQFWPLDPRPEEVFIEDIAHTLSNICRFTGHVSKFYSVAEHSFRVSSLLEEEMLRQNNNHEFARSIALWGLLHDASEAYLCDLPRPLKRAPGFGQLYKAYEHLLTEAIALRFGLTMPEPDIVKWADNVLLETERRDLMGRAPQRWKDGAIPMTERIFPWSPEQAKHRFLLGFGHLTGQNETTQSCVTRDLEM